MNRKQKTTDMKSRVRSTVFNADERILSNIQVNAVDAVHFLNVACALARRSATSFQLTTCQSAFT